jgi:hypothetical protein
VLSVEEGVVDAGVSVGAVGSEGLGAAGVSVGVGAAGAGASAAGAASSGTVGASVGATGAGAAVSSFLNFLKNPNMFIPSFFQFTLLAYASILSNVFKQLLEKTEVIC